MSRHFRVSPPRLRAASRAALFVGWACALVIAGCGRTNLDDALELGDDGGTPHGCQSNADCVSTPQTPICDLPTGKCVVCSDPSQCPAGQTCMSGQCAMHCGTGGACPSGLSCCDPACVDETSDVSHCGGCGVHCQPGQTCLNGQCKSSGCLPGLTSCGNACVDPMNDPGNCGGCGKKCVAGTQCVGGSCTPTPGCNGNFPCAVGQACCANACANVVSDVRNCGNCGIVCASPANASAACTSGRCGFVCAPGFADCDGNAFNGCEANLASVANCGACGRACPAGDACVGGVCTAPSCNGGGPCPPGEACCASGCASTGVDPRNCGSCGVVCGTPPNASAACTSGQCGFVCSPGFASCDGNAANGCEANLETDPNNCGRCGASCGPGGSCVRGTCVSGCTCPAPEACCGDAGSTCTNVVADPNNCGGCGVVCPSHPNSIPTCGAGGCGYACTGAFRDCNGIASDGCEVDTSSDIDHCGDCATVCMPGQTCGGGICGTITEGAFDPIVNPTYLSPGVHHFTTITIPAGVVVYVAGSGPQSGTLDLHATGDIVVDGTIDVSGGPGSQNTISSMTTDTGRAGSGGFTGEQQTAPVSAACAFVTGNGGSNGSGPAGTIGNCPAGPTACGATMPLLFAASPANFGGGAGVFTGYRAYGSGGGGPAGGAPGALGPAFPGEQDCTGASGGGGATNGHGGMATGAPFDGADGTLGQTQCAPQAPAVTSAFVGGGGGGSIGLAAASDLPVAATFQTGSGGGGGSADYLDRPVFGGTSGGGGGGGALRLTTSTTIVVNGQLLANGGDGADAYIGNGATANCDPQPGAAGGGGSGGIIYLQAPSITVGAAASVSAAGGAGGQASAFATGGSGGKGGLGRIRLSMMQAPFCALSGTFNPPLSSGCSPTNPAVAGFAYIAPYPM